MTKIVTVLSGILALGSVAVLSVAVGQERVDAGTASAIPTSADPQPAGSQPETTGAPLPEAPPNVRVINLKEAHEMAVRFSPNAKNIDETVVQADAMIQGAWAMLLPNLTAQGSITRNQRKIEVGFPDFMTLSSGDGSGYISQQDFGNMDMIQIPIQELWGKAFGISLNMTLFNPRSIPAISLAYDMADQARIQAQIQKNDLLFAVTSAYYQIYSVQQMIGVTEENLANAKQFLRNSEALKRSGQGTRIDVLRAEIQVMDLEKELANNHDALKMTKTALAFLINIEGDFDIASPDPVTEVSAGLSELKDEALGARVELADAALAQSVARRSKNESLMKWLPVFDLTFSWNWNAAAGFSGENDAWMLIFGAQWKLFEGGARISEYKTRKSQMRMTDNNMEQIVLAIRQEVDQGYRDAVQKRRNLDMADKQIELAETNHHLVSRQYEVGLVPSLDLLNASTNLANKRRQKVMDQLAYDLAVLTLRKAVGSYSSLAMPNE
ncbi:MAG: TolC family protein [Myxococcota bacterium]|nr:TolC family protein [Myxococcota bacterium]